MLDQFATISSQPRDLHLVHDLLGSMRSSGLWPIWSAGGRARPLQKQLAALSSLELPITARHDHESLFFFPHSTTALTPHNVTILSDRLSDLCDGLCLTCLKVRDICGGWDHPDPWTAYEAERDKVFAQRRRDSSSPRSRSSVSGSWDFGVEW